MTEIPKIVHDRLRAALPGKAALEHPHPDPDLLAAFAEQALLRNERDFVLEHLARCGDCREVLALAMPATEITAAVADEAVEPGGVPVSAGADGSAPRLTKRGWAKLLAFPHLRWAALAACGVVVASVLVLHPAKVSQKLPDQADRRSQGALASGTLTAATAVPQASISSSSVTSSPITSTPVASSPLTSSSAGSSEVTSSPMAKRSALRPANAAEPDKASPQSQMELASTLKTSQPAPPEPETLLARNDAPAIEKAKPVPSSADTQNVEAQNVEVSAQEVTQQKADSVVVPGMNAMRSNAVSGAKLAAAAPGPTLASHDVSWTIAAGLLQRSVDSGRSWQTALRADHPLLCYARLDDEVWAGGQSGTLFHSTNNGVSWVEVQPSITQFSRQIKRLSSDISYIDFRAAGEVVVTTADHAIWHSADGGKTWEVK